MPTDFLSDPLWYKDAVIYEAHVRSFFDASNDGFGDFEGLRQKLPYIESLGVNTIWLLPFLESPLKDDGYDTADYIKILPIHGTMEDFEHFLDEAHARGMRVITELVLNHTSDQHPWFQEARDPSSEKHDWYVWSETTEKYEEVRIIFTDTEVSNWTYDRKAKKYYWHRFFSHQPDLNYDNPAVREAMKEVMFFWLDKGVDGLRLDAVPYLFEREGTSSENLPETIDYIKELRQEIEGRYGPGKVLLAEANQWPEDTLPYFGADEDGKSTGVQMAFNFPIMPRMYMALRRENRRPLTEMLELTNDIPEEAQWAIFLRNHDELTLEMVTDEERDYMYHEYAADNRFRINVGIRRRLAPLLGGERRRIELMNALLLSLKGSPIIYYGDEIGMGDDPFLGDRNGVRTPMQWSADKNGGFSRAPHHKLFMPPVNRGPYAFEFVNAEDAESDEHSLLHFMRRLLALRKQHEKTFGRGSFELIPVENQSVLAFTRAYEGEKILVVTNLSRYAQSVHFPPSEGLQGMVPVEMFSQSPFPVFGEEPYHMVVAPHGFYWFALKPEAVMLEEAARQTQLRTAEAGARGELPVLEVHEGLENILVSTMARGRGREQLERLLPEYLGVQRWFGAKGQSIRRVSLADAVRLQRRPFPVYLSILRVELEDRRELYVLPLAAAYAEENKKRILEEKPGAALCWLDGPEGRGLLHDAVVNRDFWLTLFRWWKSGSKGRSLKGLYAAEISDAVRGFEAEEVRLMTGEQSNSSAIIDHTFFIKLYRRLERGANPETELLGHLTEVGFKFIPRLHGSIDFRRGRDKYALGILQEALPVETDGWNYALEMTGRFFDRVAGSKPPLPTAAEGAQPPSESAPPWLDEVASEMLSTAHVLGIRTAEMHRALARATAPGLAPVEGEAGDAERLAKRIRAEAETTRERLQGHDGAPDNLPDDALWSEITHRLDALLETGDDAPTAERIRIHGDYHLGQTLRADGEFYLLDFEGEPARSLEERRRPDSALRDVAGMLRSIEYAVLAAYQEHRDKATPQQPANGDTTAPEERSGADLDAWAGALIRWCEATFLAGYTDTAAGEAFLPPPDQRAKLLWAYLLDKVLYEVRYELSHRPTWTWLPLRGLRRLLENGAPRAAGRSNGTAEAQPEEEAV